MWWQHRARITEGMRVLHEIIAPVKKVGLILVIAFMYQWFQTLNFLSSVCVENFFDANIGCICWWDPDCLKYMDLFNV